MSRDYSFHGLILSLCLHAAVTLFLVFRPVERPPQTDTIEIDVTEKESKTRWLVDAVQTQKPIEEELKDKADLISNITQRVKKQLRARQGEVTRNSQVVRPQIKPKFTYNPNDPMNQAISPPVPNIAIGYSSFAERLPGIESGAFNELNTDRDKYFTFYRRINEQLKPRWVALVRNYLSRLSREDLRVLARNEKRTVVEVLLDREGNYFSSLIHSSSGVQALDEATYMAFRAAAPFVNPPAGMVHKDDGLIHLYYQFVVIFDPNPMAGSSNF